MGQKQGKGTKRMVTKTGRGWEGKDPGKSILTSELKSSVQLTAILTIIQ